MKIYKEKKVQLTETSVVDIKCDICDIKLSESKNYKTGGNPIDKTEWRCVPYFEIDTHHSCWGNDSCESYETHHTCSKECLKKFIDDYINDKDFEPTYSLDFEYSEFYIDKEYNNEK